MSSFRPARLLRLASGFQSLRNRFSSRPSRTITERAFRRLMIDPLEERALLSVSPLNTGDVLVSSPQGAIGTYQWTNPGRSIATDNNGDQVVAWTVQSDVLDAAGNPIVNPKDPTGASLITETNIDARYLTNDMQELVTPSTGTISLEFGGDQNGHEVQQLSINATTQTNVTTQPNIVGNFQLSLPNPNATGTYYTTPTINYDELLFGTGGNKPSTTLLSPDGTTQVISSTASTITLPANLGTVTDFPTPSNSTTNPVTITLRIGSEYLIATGVAGVSTDGSQVTWNVTRGAFGSTAASHNEAPRSTRW